MKISNQVDVAIGYLAFNLAIDKPARIYHTKRSSEHGLGHLVGSIIIQCGNL